MSEMQFMAVALFVVACWALLATLYGIEKARDHRIVKNDLKIEREQRSDSSLRFLNAETCIENMQNEIDRHKRDRKPPMVPPDRIRYRP